MFRSRVSFASKTVVSRSATTRSVPSYVKPVLGQSSKKPPAVTKRPFSAHELRKATLGLNKLKNPKAKLPGAGIVGQVVPTTLNTDQASSTAKMEEAQAEVVRTLARLVARHEVAIQKLQGPVQKKTHVSENALRPAPLKATKAGSATRSVGAKVVEVDSLLGAYRQAKLLTSPPPKRVSPERVSKEVKAEIKQQCKEELAALLRPFHSLARSQGLIEEKL